MSFPRRVSKRAADLAAALFTALVMSGAMSAAMLALALHGQPGFAMQWLRSWPIAFVVAYPLGAMLMPVAAWIRTSLQKTQTTQSESSN